MNKLHSYKLTEKVTEQDADTFLTELFADGVKIAEKLTNEEGQHYGEKEVDEVMTEKFGATHSYHWM